MKAPRIAAADYPAFRELLGRIDRAMLRTVRVAPVPVQAEAGRPTSPVAPPLVPALPVAGKGG